MFDLTANTVKTKASTINKPHADIKHGHKTNGNTVHTDNTDFYINVGVLALLLPVAILLVIGTLNIRESPVFHDGTIMPQLHDLSIVPPIALLFISLRYIVSDAARPLANKLMDPATRADAFRFHQFGHSVFEFLYFTTIAIVGICVVRDEVWFPTSLGGSGNPALALTVANEPLRAGVKTYYQVIMGYQTHNLIYVTFLRKHDKSTFELVLHDIVTVGLLVSSYMTNFVAFGANVMILNDLSDLFQYIYFVAGDMDHKPLKALSFVTLLSTWAYLRIYVYPRDVLVHTLVEGAKVLPDVSVAFMCAINIMLLMIMVMQMYWFVLFASKYRRVLFFAVSSSSSSACGRSKTATNKQPIQAQQQEQQPTATEVDVAVEFLSTKAQLQSQTQSKPQTATLSTATPQTVVKALRRCTSGINGSLMLVPQLSMELLD